MKKLVFLVFFAMLSNVFLSACKTNLEYNVTYNSRIVNEHLTETEAYTEGAAIIGLPVGEYTYLRSVIPFEHDINEISIITVSNETVYGAAAIWGAASTDSIILFFSIDLDYGDVFFYPSFTNLTGGGNNVRAITANKDGDLFFINHRHLFNDGSRTEEALLLTQIDILGNIGFTIDITELLSFSEHTEVLTPPRAIVLDDVGNIYVLADNGSVLQFDSTGVYQFSAPHPDGIWTQAAGPPFQNTDGNILFPIWDSNEGNIMFSLDNNAQSLTPYQPLSDLSDVFAFIPGLHGTELFLIKVTGVYSYCLESSEQSRVFHWLEVDTPPSIIYPAGEGRFVLLDSSDNSMFATRIAVLTRAAVQDDTRTIITLASLSPNQRFVHEFNKQSRDYRIVVLDYSDNDISVALTRFNMDMIAGKIPDIIDLTYLNYYNLANGGFLADLNMLVDNDGYINRTNFHERIFELLEVDSKLYAIAPSFMITTCLAPASLVGSTPGITLDRLMQIDMQLNNGKSLFHGVLAQSFIDMHTITNRSSLVDFGRGVVNFESDNFIQVLEYASRLERNVIAVPDDEHTSFEISIRRGNNHISTVMINYLDQLYQTELYAGTEITPIGFPVNDGVGSLMLPVSLFGIGSNTQNLSGAWAFISFLLTTMQEEMLHGIPVSRIAFEKWASYSMSPPPIEENPHISNMILVDDTMIEVTLITQDQVDRTLKMIETLGGILMDGDEIIVNIVAEEVNAFLRSNRSAEDTARVIQNRVQRYVDEQQR